MTLPNQPMRVLHWCPHFTIGGGIANSVLALSRAQRERGAEALVVAPVSSREALFAAPEGAQDHELFLWSPVRSVSIGNMAFHSISARDVARLRALEPDVVHVHAEFNPDNLRVASLFAGRQLVLSPHGAFHPLVMKSSRLGNKVAYARLAKRLLYRKAAAFHALTSRERDHVQLLLPGASVYCAPQGSTLPSSEGPRTSSDDVRGEVRLLFLGRLDLYTKGLDVLVAAFAAAARQCASTDLRLTLAGPSAESDRHALEQQARGLGVADRVDLPGTASRPEVARLLTTHSLYIQLSRHEGLSASVTEALCAGLPAVLSEEACPSDEIATLEHVRVVPPSVNESAEAIAMSVKELEALRAAARRSLPFVELYFSWDRIAGVHLDAYEQIRQTHGSSPADATDTRAAVG